MRRTLTPLLATIVLASCGGDEGADTFIRANLGGALWSAAAAEGIVVYSVDFPDGGAEISVIASKRIGAGSQFIALNLPIPPDVGSYPLDGTTTRVAYASCPDNVLADCIYWSSVTQHPGTLTIDHVDPEAGIIEGDFAVTGYALGDTTGTTKLFTGGHFRIHAPSVFTLE